MTSEEVLLEKIKVLPPNRKQQVLDFVEFLESKEAKQESKTLFRVRSKRMGFRKDLNYDKTSELLEEIEGAMITPDANILLYAYNEDAPKHH